MNAIEKPLPHGRGSVRIITTASRAATVREWFLLLLIPLATLQAAVREWAEAKRDTMHLVHELSAGPERWTREVRLERAEEVLRSLTSDAPDDTPTPE